MDEIIGQPAQNDITAANRPVGYLEVLNRVGKVAQRLPVYNRDLRIGRAYDNDVVLDDPFVCPHHAALRWVDDRLVAVDLDSVNGIAKGKSGRKRLIPIDSNDQVRVGHTLLRYRSGEEELPPTLIDRFTHSPLRLLEKPLVQGLIVLLSIALHLYGVFLNSVEKFELTKELPELFGLLAAIFVWAMIWSFASRMVSHRWKFWTHTAITLSCLVIYYLAALAYSYISYLLAIDATLAVAENLLGAAVLGFAIYLQMNFVSVASHRLIIIRAASAAVGLLLLNVLVWYAEKDDFSNWPQYRVTLKAPAFRMASSSGTEQFFADLPELARAAAEDAEEDKD